ncbi:MAG: NAD(+)/NADH kinase [Candidatus Altiarchaeota archaeon]|nr:NAD(+)/NADH kinase [Candidatus Altiarchaeota archaeon]
MGDDFARKVLDRLAVDGIVLSLDPITAEKIGEEKTDVKDMRVDLAVIIGGDGTILWAINELQKDPLVLGINVGNVGYLTELTPEDVMDKLDLLLKGDYEVEERMKLLVDDRVEALNEVLVVSAEPATLLEFGVRLDNLEIARFRADGVIVSTPTGSTAYSLSAGGALLHPKVKGYVITPVNPFQRKQHPLVVPEDSETTIELLREEREACLIVDGRRVKKIGAHQKISIRKAQHKARFVRFTQKRG